ncbi:MAG: sulfotransferase family protein, partial [archaeon]
MYKSIKIDQPIFIIGVGRSGTTLLQSMLNAHSKIIFPPETHFFRNYIANPKVNKNLLNENLKWFKNKLFNDENLLKLDIDLENIFDLLMEQSNFSLINFYKRILMKYSENQNKTIIGDKDPKNIENLKEINKYFPQANILHIIRDPRDVLLSRMKAEWSKDRHYFLHIMAYREQLRFGRNWGPKLFQENYHELFYEELIENPRKELKKITNRLNINYDEKMLYFNKKADEIIKGEETKWKKNCFKPVMKSNKNKWKKNLSKK